MGREREMSVAGEWQERHVWELLSGSEVSGVAWLGGCG